MRAILIADNAGSGHTVRCHALADELRQYSWDAFVIGPHEEIPLTSHDVAIVDMRDNRFPLPGIAKLVRIVDEPGRASSCDLLVCGSAGANPDMFGGVAGRVLAGPAYSILRPEFLREREISRFRSGYADVRFVVDWTATRMAEEMAVASFVITFAGMRAMEAACVGAPAVLIVRNPGEQLNAAGLAGACAAVVATEDEVPIMVDELLALPSLTLGMSEKAKGFVDGGGRQRVAQAIRELIS